MALPSYSIIWGDCVSAIKNVKIIQIENTAYCNRKCAWCPQSKLNITKDQVMEWDTLRKIIEELIKLNYKGRIHPYGNGEPLTDDNCLDKIRYIRNSLPECFIYIATNGDYVNRPYSFKDLWESGVNLIQCNHYDDKNAKLKECSHRDSIKIHGRYYQTGIEHMNLGDLRPTFYNRAGNVQITNITPSGTCWFPGVKLYFNYLGDMLICCADWKYEDKVGNIHNQLMEELLESPKLKIYQDKLAQGRQDELPLCSQCNLIRHQEAI